MRPMGPMGPMAAGATGLPWTDKTHGIQLPGNPGNCSTRPKRGDSDAVDRLLATHREPLRRDDRPAVLDPALAGRLDASDVVQDVLLEASRRLDDYLRPPGHAVSTLWLRHIAKDHVIDAHRRHRRAPAGAASTGNSRSSPAALADQSSVELAAQFLDQELTPGLGGHPARDGTALFHAGGRHPWTRMIARVILMRLEHLSNQEIAAMLGLSEAGGPPCATCGRCGACVPS